MTTRRRRKIKKTRRHQGRCQGPKILGAESPERSRRPLTSRRSRLNKLRIRRGSQSEPGKRRATTTATRRSMKPNGPGGEDTALRAPSPGTGNRQGTIPKLRRMSSTRARAPAPTR